MKTRCIKNIKSNKGLQFTKGNSYDFVADCGGIRIYFSEFEFVTISSKKFFNKYFKI